VTSPQALLIAVFVALYLADCLVLLRPTEAIVFPRRYRVRLDFGIAGYSMRGRVPLLLNPLTPWLAGFRSRAICGDDAASSTARHRLKRLRPCGTAIRFAWPLLVLHGLLLFGVLPYLLLTARYFELAIALTCAFFSACCVVYGGYRLIPALGVTRGQYWSLGFQAIVCLPNSLNFLRKLALLATIEETALDLLPRTVGTLRAQAAGDLRHILETARLSATDPSEADRLAALQQQIEVDLV
jgi:hypothetical protein